MCRQEHAAAHMQPHVTPLALSNHAVHWSWLKSGHHVTTVDKTAMHDFIHSLLGIKDGR
jgi:hypothetical protein